MTDFAPTDEQAECLALFKTGESMVIEAGAGTGKTSTLTLLAENTDRPARYLAFNKAIVTDVKGKMPRHVAASTAHSLAFQAIGKRYSGRLNAPRMASWRIALMLNVDGIALRLADGERKMLSDRYLGGVVMRTVTNFCHTVDDAPSWKHVPYIEGIDLPRDGRRTYDNNNLVAKMLEPAIAVAWADIQKLDGALPFRHDHYLKLWQLSHPTSVYDLIFFDEAQDANPVMAAVIAEQTHAQRVYVGDSNQEIYGFTGAVNTLAQIDTPNRRYLTQSFRFGHEIAAAANGILALLDTPMRLTGNPAIASTVGPLDRDPDAILCRTNAGAVNQVLDAQKRGVSAHLVGGGSEVLSFAKAAGELQDGKSTWHFELACFNSWGEVQTYVEQDAQGDELRLLVNLVDEYGVETIVDALEAMPSEKKAELVVSTAHKAKGREWRNVQIDADFAEIEESDPELRLRYVAVTRARQNLDLSLLAQAKAAF